MDFGKDFIDIAIYPKKMKYWLPWVCWIYIVTLHCALEMFSKGMVMTGILLLSWFKYGCPTVSYTGKFRVYISQGVTKFFHVFTFGPMEPKTKNNCIVYTVKLWGLAMWHSVLT